jgi:hypothetical protein
MPQNGVIRFESEESNPIGNLWEEWYRRTFKVKSGAGTGMAWNIRRDWTTGC